MALLWVAAVAVGAGSASIDVGIASVVSEHTSMSSRAPAMAGWNAITGARGIVAAFLMSALLQVGIVDVTTGLLLCAVCDGDRRGALRPHRERRAGRRSPAVTPGAIGRAATGLRAAVGGRSPAG